ncbi:organellar and viral DNA polymerase type B [Trichomonas vaginalis G3]|uniref:organellar and viral DNA polymerase type B n=1 Tax=Trichomonas vaginalis (strain ATCC PRA-98 / G3) TaxID=412133 RepID=UPI0021E5BE56|nr:organellar and viral DNA polymerase type B [Trichomonas vaginalis G3]KAI5508483.1 organellar and viral DNA polymerase type B [Trichomonas vaginalis G3]
MYRKLSKLEHSEIKQLLTEANIDVAKHYATNKKALADILNDYNGAISYDRIHEFIKPQRSEDEVHARAFPLNDVAIDLYHRRSVPHEVRREMFDITNANVGETRRRDDILKQQRREMFKSAIEQVRKANDVIRSIDDKPKEGERWLKKDEENRKRNVKSGNRLIDFNIEALDEPNRDYLHKHFGKVFMRLLEKIKINSQQRWMVCYKLGGKYECSTLNLNNIGTLLHQLLKENFISEIEANAAGIVEMHYDFFLTNIKNLTEIKMYDLTEYEGLTMSDVKKGKPKKRPYRDESTLTNDQKAILEALKQTGNPALIESFWKDNGEKKFYKKRSGQFWKYLCTLPINLERYQIFNELNKRTAALMTEDNCFVYACIQAGVNEETIDHMREVIRVRTYDKDSEFSLMKLYKALYDGQEIAFDLCKSATPAFEEKFNFSIQTKTSFIRKLKF